ncbi:MAG: hypothetical protein NC411_05955 [Bacteroides sp.]|nr:hypothetical protein [Bacteroides sp.]
MKELSPEELYVELMRPMYGERPYYRGGDMGEGMSVIEQLFYGYWKERFLLNHDEKMAYTLMNSDRRLIFITMDDVVWQDVERLPNSGNAYMFAAQFPFAISRFSNGVAEVKWTLHPDGMYFMDSDGYGMQDDDETVLRGYIDRHARMVIPFMDADMNQIKKYRPEAERIVSGRKK